MQPKGLFRVSALVLALAVTAAACGGGGDDNASDDTSDTSSESFSDSRPPNDEPDGESPTTTETTEPPAPEPEFDVEGDLDQQDAEVQELQDAVLAGGPEGGSDFVSTEQYLIDAVTHMDTIWTKWFLDNGWQEPFVGYEILMPGETWTTQCVTDGQPPGSVTWNSQTPNAFYCGADSLVGADGNTYKGVLILPVETMALAWSGTVLGSTVDTGRVGDFAAGVVAAHEFGHHVADELAQQSATPVIALGMPNAELIADCFAGVWADSMWRAGQLGDGDIDEALGALEAIGDWSIGTTGHHGTPEDRMTAFQVGYYGFEQGDEDDGDPVDCINTYWK